MPWSVKKDDRCPAAEPWGVVKDDDGELEGCHASEEEAKEQQAALYANERGLTLIEGSENNWAMLQAEMAKVEQRAEWDTAYRNNLPDRAFAYVEPGGEKDDEGKTVPRSLRHFPHHNAEDTLDLPHLRNALSRGPQSNVWPNGKSHLERHAREEGVGERTAPLRENIVRALYPALRLDGSEDVPTLTGHFAVFDQWTEINSVIEGRFMERIMPGAFRRAFNKANRDRVRVLFQHGQDPDIGDKPIAKILSLTEDSRGAQYTARLFGGLPQLVIEGLREGEYGSSFRFSVPEDGEAWDWHPEETAVNPSGLPERSTHSLDLFEFGPVTWPAYAGATAGIRSLTQPYREGHIALPVSGDDSESEPDSASGDTADELPTPEPTSSAVASRKVVYPPISREAFLEKFRYG